MGSAQKRMRNIFKDFSIIKFVRPSEQLRPDWHETRNHLAIACSILHLAFFPGVPLVAGDPERFPGLAVLVVVLVDPSPSGALLLMIACLSPRHTRAVLPVPLVAAVVL